MKVVVTGGAGFIGSHLIEKLVERGDIVVAIDNLCSGKKENLAKIINKIQFVQDDIRKKGIITNLKNVDAIIHLAALINIHESFEKPLLYHEINSEGTLNLLIDIEDFS